MTLNTQHIKNIAYLRMAVGLLGEQANPKWWTSSFCNAQSKVFLSPIIPRTYGFAQFQGVVCAAAIVHDDRIGVGKVFHLFRLPEDIEQALLKTAKDEIKGYFTDIMKDAVSAARFLFELGGRIQKASLGPVKVGPLSALRNASAWKDTAACYLNGFENKRETFPFFSD